jgi:hypothetical protein
MANQSNGWTRERPKGVDAMRDYQVAHAPNGVRAREWYPSDQVLQTDDGDCMYRDSWWHPVRADGRYPALPVEDGRKWVPTNGHTLTGRGWNAIRKPNGEWLVRNWANIGMLGVDVAIESGDYVLPYRDGDTRDTLPPLPSDETPAPLTPAEEATLRAPQAFADGVRETMAEYQAAPPIKTPTSADLALHLTAPEPSRLEIAARIMAGFAASPDSPACKSTTPEGIEAEQIAYANMVAASSLRWTDALIAAARKGGGA